MIKDRPVGANHYKAKLTEKQVLEMRASDMPDTYWAHKLNVTVPTVHKARTGETWKHLDNPQPKPTRTNITPSVNQKVPLDLQIVALEMKLERMERQLRRMGEAVEGMCNGQADCAAVKKTETAVRLQCMGVIRQWEESGKSVKNLLFRIQTTKFRRYWEVE